MSINVCIPGISGRMGLEIAKVVNFSSDINLSSATVRKNSRHFDQPISSILNYPVNGDNFKISDNLYMALENCDVCIDFTHPSYSLEILKTCSEVKKPIVIGTTGYSSDQEEKIKSYSSQIAIFKSSNMSIGINLCIKALRKVSESVQSSTKVDIIEHHHQHKKDMPSGTSLLLESEVKKANKNLSINHHCIRSGNVVGDHKILFTLSNEIIEINHRANDRKIFAEGSVEAAKFISNKKAGFFNMDDIL